MYNYYMKRSNGGTGQGEVNNKRDTGKEGHKDPSGCGED